MHLYHLVNYSMWPFMMSTALIPLLMGTMLQFNNYYGLKLMGLSILCFTVMMYIWMSDINRESSLTGNHTSKVSTGLSMGIMLFIMSEIMLFVGLFWSFFHSALFPSVEMGMTWPSYKMEQLNPFEMPLLNTVILLTSAALVTMSHHSISDSLLQFMLPFMFGMVLMVLFMFLQYVEFKQLSFDITDSMFGSVFYTATTFHGLHVMVAGLWLTTSLVSTITHNQFQGKHVNILSSLWYFHFTDMVWLVLYAFFYLWTFC